MPIHSLLLKHNKFSEITLDDQSISTATSQTLTCSITGLSAETAVTWIDPKNNLISASDTDNYEIDQGDYVLGSKSSSLTIKTPILSTLSSGDVFKCKLKSVLYPAQSPDVVKEATVTVLSLGMGFYFIVIYIFVFQSIEAH